jgi:S1-C subfamily serine protease
VKVDESKDLALLEARIDRPALSMVLWSEVPIGLEALVIGYPQPRVQGLSKKVTLGIVNGVRIEGVDAGYFQLSAEVQKGNSGGPVLAPNGAVIGVVLSKLNALSLAEKTGDLAQNVNYALKSSSLLQFLNEAGIKVEVRPLDMSQAVRPFETYRKAETSVLAVIARDLPNKPQGQLALPGTLNLVPDDQ